MPTPARSSAPPDRHAPATDPRPPRPSAKALGKRRETFHVLSAEQEGGESEVAAGEGKDAGQPKKRVLPYRARRAGMGGLGSNLVDDQIMHYIQQRDEKPLIPENAVFLLTTREKGLPSVDGPERPLPLLSKSVPAASSSTPSKPPFTRLTDAELVGSRLRARAEEVEDTSDAAYLARHRKYEATERRQRKREVEKLTHEHYLLKQRLNEYVLMDAAAFGGEEKKRAMLRGAEELDQKYQALLGPRVEKTQKETPGEASEKAREDLASSTSTRGRPRGRMSEPPVHTPNRGRPKQATTYSHNNSARSTPQPHSHPHQHPHSQNRVAELRGIDAPSIAGYIAAAASASPISDPGTPMAASRPRSQQPLFTTTPLPIHRSQQSTNSHTSPNSVVRIHGRDSHGRFAPKLSIGLKRTASGQLKLGSSMDAAGCRTLTTYRSVPNLSARKRTPPPQTPVLVRAASRPSRAERNLRRPTAFGVPLGAGVEEEREFQIPTWVEVRYPESEVQQKTMDTGHWLEEEEKDEEEMDWDV
ncbi:hypothetical protein DACRYDRAFT_115604 [Dacryopinax primogenitus]|uniref:Something about silencing protein 4 domain-containing protein n=1 Tax=Dacryopinax primogenitus (strain DJM 731) TaxID=1858805 RepID=M5G2U9_DACPD|nr:uncharacterized protein DACRYDRAFT_115604 [Dacryopinax primogenitus]EJU02550.1 hypothetical protein DACRYDRAFT_115604 [Dacryopinax primogenitus]